MAKPLRIPDRTRAGPKEISTTSPSCFSFSLSASSIASSS